MFEGVRVAAAQVTLSEAMALARTHEDQLELAVREHARMVYRIAFSVLRNHYDAEDATQETFMRVLRYRRRLSALQDMRSWVARIAWRVAVERRRSSLQTKLENVSQLVAELRSPVAAADEAVLRTEMAALLEQLIAALPGKLRDPLTLSTVEEMSPADIAEVLGVNEAAVRSRLFRARQILREKLAQLLERKHGI
jgi:RNA polymerase sigma-70 factor (ECF subfamily)